MCSGPGPAGWSVASPGCPGSMASAPTVRDPGEHRGPRAAVPGETLGKTLDQSGPWVWAVCPPLGPRAGASGHGCSRRRAHGPVGGLGRPRVPVTVRRGAEDRLPACILPRRLGPGGGGGDSGLQLTAKRGACQPVWGQCVSFHHHCRAGPQGRPRTAEKAPPPHPGHRRAVALPPPGLRRGGRGGIMAGKPAASRAARRVMEL